MDTEAKEEKEVNPSLKRNNFEWLLLDAFIEWPLVYFGVICGLQSAWCILAIIGTLGILSAIFLDQKPEEIDPCGFWHFWYEVISSFCIWGIFIYHQEVFLMTAFSIAGIAWIRRRMVYHKFHNTKHLWV